MDQLSFSVTPDGDGVWQVHAHLQTETFSGKGWSWGSPESLSDFADELSAYPLRSDEPPRLQLAYGAGKGDDVRLAVEIRPLGSLGTLEVRVEIADADDPSCRLKAKLLTSYAAVDRLVPQLRGIAAGKCNLAVLTSG